MSPVEWAPGEEFWWLRDWDYAQLHCTLAHEAVSGPTGEPHQVLDETGLTRATEVGEFWRQWKGENIHRSVKVWAEAPRGEPLALVSWVIDIDGPEAEPDDIRVGDAQGVAVRALDWLLEELRFSTTAVRVYFSGHKGFHIEVDPFALEAIGIVPDTPTDARPGTIGASGPYAAARARLLRHLLGYEGRRPPNKVGMRGTVIDPQKERVRLTNSINRWRDNGQTRAGRKVRLRFEELLALSPEAVFARSRVRVPTL